MPGKTNGGSANTTPAACNEATTGSPAAANVFSSATTSTREPGNWAANKSPVAESASSPNAIARVWVAVVTACWIRESIIGIGLLRSSTTDTPELGTGPSTRIMADDVLASGGG